jgi:hypothetical protein
LLELVCSSFGNPNQFVRDFQNCAVYYGSNTFSLSLLLSLFHTHTHTHTHAYLYTRAHTDTRKMMMMIFYCSNYSRQGKGWGGEGRGGLEGLGNKKLIIVGKGKGGGGREGEGWKGSTLNPPARRVRECPLLHDRYHDNVGYGNIVHISSSPQRCSVKYVVCNGGK